MASFAEIDESALVTAAAEVEASVKPTISSCKCTSRWIDEACIWRAINDWTPGNHLICWGCFKGKGSQRDHACMGMDGFSFIPIPWEETQSSLNNKAADILKNPETQQKLFAVYLESHPDGVNLAKNLDWALQHLMKTCVWKLKEALLEKDCHSSPYC